MPRNGNRNVSRRITLDTKGTSSARRVYADARVSRLGFIFCLQDPIHGSRRMSGSSSLWELSISAWRLAKPRPTEIPRYQDTKTSQDFMGECFVLIPFGLIGLATAVGMWHVCFIGTLLCQTVSAWSLGFLRSEQRWQCVVAPASLPVSESSLGS